MNSEKVLLQVDKPQMNHNAGTIAFGPDGYLYLPLVDGGGANDMGEGHSPGGNAQDTSKMLGKILLWILIMILAALTESRQIIHLWEFQAFSLKYGL